MASKNRMELFRLAKKVKGLSPTEKRVLIPIADTCSMREKICKKSAATIADEYGVPERTWHYGLRGRNRKDGSEFFPGLIRRGLVSVLRGGLPKDGVPTVYGVNEAVLRSFCDPETSAQNDGEQAVDLCTNDPKPLHNEAKTSAQWQTSSKESSTPSSNGGGGGDFKTSMEGIYDWFEDETGNRFSMIPAIILSSKARAALTAFAIAANATPEMVSEALLKIGKRKQGWDGIKNHQAIVLAEFPATIRNIPRPPSAEELEARRVREEQRRADERRRDLERDRERKRRDFLEGQAVPREDRDAVLKDPTHWIWQYYDDAPTVKELAECPTTPTN